MLYQKGFSSQRGVSQQSNITVQDCVQPGAAQSPCASKVTAQRAQRHGERLRPASKSIPCLPRSAQNLRDPNTWGFRHCLQEIC